MGPPASSKPDSKDQKEPPQKYESENRSKNQPTVVSSSGSLPDSGGNADRTNGASEGSKTWYTGGTWRRGSKATAVTQVAKESILAATDKASELLPSAPSSTARDATNSVSAPSKYLSRSLQRSAKPPAAASPIPESDFALGASNHAHVASQQSTALKGASGQNQLPASGKHSSEEKTDANPSPSPLLPDPSTSKRLGTQEINGSVDSLPWRGWFSRNEETKKPEPQQPPDVHSQSALNKAEDPIHRRNSDPSAASSSTTQNTLPRSWLGLWAARSAKTGSADAAAFTAAVGMDKPPSSSVPTTPKTESTPLAPETQSTSFAKSPGWAFWSRESAGNITGDTSDKGELVLAESNPQTPAESSDLHKTQRDSGKRPLSVESAQKNGVPESKRSQMYSNAPNNIARKSPQKNIAEGALAKVNDDTKNLLLPPIADTYRLAPRPSLFQSLSRWWQDNQSRDGDHVKLLHNPPRIKRALAIGVHGYFPAPLIRSVLGQPTGTSVRFADGAASAIRSWTGAQGYECEVEKVALEGEGKIVDRVDLLWKLLLNWIDNVRKADFILVACHSQGVPVSIMLIAKLIEFGCVQEAKIGVCAMAGVNLGPFIDLKSRWIGGSAGELFEFGRFDSQVSKDYNAALTSVLRFGVRITYIGSIDDQLVSLESSTFGTIQHPYVYRAVFVNGSVHAPDFLTHLVGFALKLRNLGISDHGLIRELSLPLAGSLYSGEGHSTIYEDDAVYFLAVQNALETSTIGEKSLQRVRGSSSGPQNPYILPFSLRGVLEEEHVRNELHEETQELLKLYDQWRPSTKVLKDVKFRLEGIRSKL